MIKYALPILFAGCFMSFVSYGQTYESIYAVSTPEVQQKMNQNKMAGVAILTAIQTHHTIGISGVSVSQKAELENLLSTHPEILSFSVSEDATSVLIESQATFTRETFVQLTEPLNPAILGYSATYTTNE